MSATFRIRSWQARAVTGLLLVVMLLLVSACSSPGSYVVLLEQEAGRTGQIQIDHPGGRVLVDHSRMPVRLDGDRPEPLRLTNFLFENDFDAALAASPASPRRFIVYFDLGEARLNEASMAQLPAIRSALARRTAPDVSIIGHTDSVGSPLANEKLGLIRAEAVRNLLADVLAPAIAIQVSSHGEGNPLIPTPDEVEEARNRRVEIIIR